MKITATIPRNVDASKIKLRFVAEMEVTHPSRRQSTKDGLGFEWIKQPDTNEEVELIIDVAAIMRSVGAQAARNRTGSSRACDGAIKAKHLGRVKAATS